MYVGTKKIGGRWSYWYYQWYDRDPATGKKKKQPTTRYIGRNPGFDRLAAGVVGFGFNFLMGRVPRHDFQQQMLIKDRWESKIRRERWAEKRADPNYQMRLEFKHSCQTPSVAFIQYQASRAPELRAQAIKAGTAINYGALAKSFYNMEQGEKKADDEEYDLSDTLARAEEMLPGCTEDVMPEAPAAEPTPDGAPDFAEADAEDGQSPDAGESGDGGEVGV